MPEPLLTAVYLPGESKNTPKVDQKTQSISDCKVSPARKVYTLDLWRTKNFTCTVYSKVHHIFENGIVNSLVVRKNGQITY